MSSHGIQYDYRVKALQGEDRIVHIKAANVAPSVICATSSDFPNGLAGYWSPETFLLASVAASYVNTYQLFCDRNKVQPVSLECEASGTVASVDGRLAFTGVMLNPIITLASHEDEEMARKILEKAHHHCLISNSLNCPVSVSENILVLVK